MPEQVYDREKLRKQVLDHLRQQSGRQPTGQVVSAIGAQYWAVEGELEALYQRREVTFVAGSGWQAAEPPERPQQATGLDLLMGGADHG